jgi:hypothetical protein
MTKYNFKLFLGCIVAVVFTALGANAQEASTPASIERLKTESLNLTNSQNASARPLDDAGYYSQVGLGYDIEKGSFKRAQSGAFNTGYKFTTDGGGKVASMKDAYFWGRFEYSRTRLRDAQYNATLFDPLRGTPFYIADANKSQWINQLYDMSVSAASPKLWNRLYVGVSLDYQNGVAAKQLDPRPLTNLSKFTVKPGVTALIGKAHSIGAYYSYYSRREDGEALNANNYVPQPVYNMTFPGFFVDREVGGMGSDDNERIYNANSMGGGLQYSLKTAKLNILLSGDYSFAVEDVTNDYRTPKMVGTTAETSLSVSLNAIYKPTVKSMFLLDVAYTDCSMDGIQYVQVYDNSFEVAKWITKLKNVRSNQSASGINAKVQYMRTTRGKAYNWTVGASFATEKLDDIYYMPESTQGVSNLKFNVFGRKNFMFAKYHSILVGANFGMKMNSSASINYNGVKGDTDVYKDFTLKDYYYQGTGYMALGGSLSYAYSNLFKGRSSLFVTAQADVYQATDNKELFGRRGFLNVMAGLMF